MPEHLLDHGKGDAFVERERGRGVPHSVHAEVRQAGGLEYVDPLLLISARVDQAAVFLAPHQAMVFPYVRRCHAFAILRRAVRLECCHEFGGQLDLLAAAFLDLAECQAAAMTLRAMRRVPGAAGRAQLRRVRWDTHMGAPGRADLRAFAQAWSSVPFFGASRDVGAAVPPGKPLELEPDT